MRLILAFREAGMRFSRDGCAFLSQAIAFNALFAIFPLLVLVLTAASVVLPNADEQVLSFFDTFAPALHDTVAANVQTYVYGRGVSSAIAFVVVVWAAKNLFMGLAYALNRALAVPKSRPLLHDMLLSIVMLPLTGLVMLVAIGMPVVVSIVFTYAHVRLMRRELFICVRRPGRARKPVALRVTSKAWLKHCADWAWSSRLSATI